MLDVQNFMFSHFLDGGNGEENGMDESYNDDENGGYEGMSIAPKSKIKTLILHV